MQDLDNKVSDLCRIIKLCEDAELASFSYKDSMISIQFNKLTEGSNYYINNDNDIIEKYVDELKQNNINIDVDEVTISNILQEQEMKKDKIVVITSPFVGTVEFSNHIKLVDGEIPISKGDVICSIEAMKIYNDIKSPVTGVIVQVLADECSLVEFEQPLVKVRVD